MSKPPRGDARYTGLAEAMKARANGLAVYVLAECEGAGYERIWDGEEKADVYVVYGREPAPDPAWSTQQPTKPGVYWWRYKNSKYPMATHLTFAGSEAIGLFDSSAGTYLKDLDTRREWWPVPAEPPPC